MAPLVLAGSESVPRLTDASDRSLLASMPAKKDGGADEFPLRSPQGGPRSTQNRGGRHHTDYCPEAPYCGSPAPDDLTVQDNLVEGTTVIQVHLDQLEPGPGPATMNYILGAKTHRLMHINVTWSYPGNPTVDERSKIAAAGVELASYFRAQNWKPNGTAVAVPEGANAIVLFAGADRRGAGVELSVSGVALQTDRQSGPPPTGMALLRISYSADLLHPDIVTIAPGSF